MCSAADFVLTFAEDSCMIFGVVKAYNFTEGGTPVKNQTYRMTMLFDFYGDILTPRQRELFDLYYNEDLSLAEIAENCGISRQGVRDVIVRAEARNVDELGKLVVARVQGVAGITRTLTCPVVHL